jgi:hypothetical protein
VCEQRCFPVLEPPVFSTNLDRQVPHPSRASGWRVSLPVCGDEKAPHRIFVSQDFADYRLALRHWRRHHERVRSADSERLYSHRASVLAQHARLKRYGPGMNGAEAQSEALGLLVRRGVGCILPRAGDRYGPQDRERSSREDCGPRERLCWSTAQDGLCDGPRTRCIDDRLRQWSWFGSPRRRSLFKDERAPFVSGTGHEDMRRLPERTGEQFTLKFSARGLSQTQRRRGGYAPDRVRPAMGQSCSNVARGPLPIGVRLASEGCQSGLV